MRLRLAILTALLLPGTASAYVIAPGTSAYFESGAGCTLNFVFDGIGPAAGRVFIGTAAHCTAPEDRMLLGSDAVSTGEVVGTVAARGAFTDESVQAQAAEDWALIEILPRFHKDVDPAMRGHLQTPARITTAAEMAAGDELLTSGYGVLTEHTEPTRERRPAEWVIGDDGWFGAFAPLTSYGDSGGPIVDAKTRGALGIVSHLTPACSYPCTMGAVSITELVEGAAARGVPVKLRAVGEKPPAPLPPPPPAAPAQAEPPPPAAAPPPPGLTLSGRCRSGRLTLRVSGPVASARLVSPRRRALPLDRPVRLRVRGRRVRVKVEAVTGDGVRLRARRAFSC